MYAIVRLNRFDEAKLAQAAPQLEEFQQLHASLPGYAGSMLVDLGQGQRLVVNLWNSQEDAAKALSVLDSEVRRVLMPLMRAPSELIGTGPVVSTDVARQTL